MRVSKRTRTIGPNTVVASTTYESVMPKMARPAQEVHDKISWTSNEEVYFLMRVAYGAACEYCRAVYTSDDCC